MGKGIFIPPLIGEDDLTCIKFNIPNNPLYRQSVLGHLWVLGRSYYWNSENPEDEQAEQVANLFMRTMYDSLVIGGDCEDSDNDNNDCFRLNATSSGIKFYPNSPFKNNLDDDVSFLGVWSSWEREKAKFPKWINSLTELFGVEIDLDTMGYGATDVFVSPLPESNDPIGALEDLIDFVQDVVILNFPRLEIDLVGNGEMVFNLLSINGGGSAIFVVDNASPLDLILEAILEGNFGALQGVQIAELQREIVQIPPETITNVSVPISLEGGTDTPHNIKVYFTPRFDDELTSPVGVGGGFDNVEICGNLRVLSPDGSEINNLTHKLNQHIRSDVIMTTAQELCEAVECGIVRVASRIVSGSAGNLVGSVTIDKDTGGITVKSTVTGTPSPDVNATSEEFHYGGTAQVERKYSEFIKDILDYHANNVPMLSAVLRIENKYNTIEFTEDKISQIYANLDSADPKLSLMPSGMANYLYCDGVSLQSIAGFILDEVLITKQDIHLIANQILSQSQIDEWYTAGTAIPDSNFFNAPCARFSTFEHVYTSENANAQTQLLIPQTYLTTSVSRMIRVSASGKFTSGDGSTQDICYRVDSQGNKTRTDWTEFRVLAQGSFNTLKKLFAPNNIEYNESGNYEWSIEIPAHNTASIVYRLSGAIALPVTGEVTFKYTDLGTIE